MEFKVYESWNDVPQYVGAEVDQILLQAFPPEERRELTEFHDLLDGDRLELLTAEEDRRTYGMLMVWNLDEMVFLENFAVTAASRGHGLGSRMLDFVGEYWKKPAILEVEPPQGDIERRRIGFYQRNGFHLSDFPYLMPNLRGQETPLPLLLMSRPGEMDHAAARAAAEMLYRTAYKNKKCPQYPDRQI